MLGIHRTVRTRYPTSTPAVFLDRDGVVVDETGYLHKPSDVRLIARTSEAISNLNSLRIPVVVVTNQAGIARGYYDWPAFLETQLFIEDQLKPAHLDGVWACGYHPDGTGPLAADHEFRKPHPGMVLDAAAEMNLDLANSWLIGDKTIDIETAVNANLAGAILVRTGYGRDMENEVRTLTSVKTAICVEDDLYNAVQHILTLPTPLSVY